MIQGLNLMSHRAMTMLSDVVVPSFSNCGRAGIDLALEISSIPKLARQGFVRYLTV